jgi:eukaryotic-like serine/threonine-protein kinase
MMVVNRAFLVELFYYTSVSCTRKIKIVIESLMLRSYKLEKVLLVGLLFLGILLSLGSVVSIRTTTAQTGQPDFTTYENPKFGIRVQYPSDWGRLDLSFLGASADIDFYPLNDTSGAKDVRIQVNQLPLQNMTLDQYTNTQINSTEGQILESNVTTLGNLPAHEIVFTDIGLKTLQVWTLKDDKVYAITYVAEEDDYDNDLQIAQRIIESFAIIS